MASTVPLVNLTNMNGLALDVFLARQGKLFKPDYDWLVRELAELVKSCAPSNERLSFAYQNAVLKPFFDFIITLGWKGFEQTFTGDEKNLSPEQKFYRNAIPAVAEALLQIKHKNEDSHFESDLEAFQSVVSDLYTNVVIKKVEGVVQQYLAPLVKWAPSESPHTIPAFNKYRLKLGAGVVSLPPEYRHGGLFAWATLGHEVGHNLLRSHPDLLDELKANVKRAVRTCDSKVTKQIVEFWESCTEETACDVLSTLAIGPVAVVGLIGYFRGVRKDGKLSNKASLHATTHPPDWLRARIGLVIISKFFAESVKDSWEAPLRSEIEKDKPEKNVIFIKFDHSSDPPIASESTPIPIDLALKTAEVAALAIAAQKLGCFNKKLIDLVMWRDIDELMSYAIQRAIHDDKDKLPELHIEFEKINAGQVLSGAIREALESGHNREKCLTLMKKYLRDMTHRNQFSNLVSATQPT